MIFFVGLDLDELVDFLLAVLVLWVVIKILYINIKIMYIRISFLRYEFLLVEMCELGYNENNKEEIKCVEL